MTSAAIADAPAAARRAEVGRVQNHLGRAIRRLRQADVSRWTSAQRRRRERLVLELGEYRARGRFPANSDFPGRLVPYFVDAAGTRCAVAHLIHASGDGALVERVAASANHARVFDLSADGELHAWLARSGLTIAEAAAIQPRYGCVRATDCICDMYFEPPIVEARSWPTRCCESMSSTAQAPA